MNRPRASSWKKGLFVVSMLGTTVGLAPSCGHAPPPSPPPKVSAAELPPADAIPGTFDVNVSVVVTAAGDEKSLDARLRKEPGRLSLTGLENGGKTTFELEQDDSRVKLTRFAETGWQFSPTYVLLDLHRMFDAPLGAAIPEGRRSGLARGVLVKEHWAEGRLRHRSYTETEAQGEEPKISIAYDGSGPDRLPSRITLKNRGQGYTLELSVRAR